MYLADAWYSSGTLWTAAGAVAVLFTGAIATYVAFSLANPVRRLECVMSAAPLLQGAAQEMPGSLRITWDGEELKDPHVLEVTLTSRGRRDIARDDFDQPLEFRVGARIIALLRTASGPNLTTFRAVAFENDLLKVGPGLIGRRQSIKFTLLAAGHEPELTSSAAAVRDVDVEVLASERPSHARSTGLRMAAGLAVTAGMAGLVLVGVVIGHSSPPGKAFSPASSSAASSLRSAQMELNSGRQASELSGISLLQHVMKAAPAYQPTAMQALDSFIQKRSPTGSDDPPVASVTQTALNVLKDRNPADDHGFGINLSHVNLTNADLSGMDFSNANLLDDDFDTANLTGANLRGANLDFAFVGGADLAGANLEGASLDGASFYKTTMCRGSVPADPQLEYNCNS
jgi:hypothetical protein